MKIAQVAPLVESVPPAFYGGTERIVSYLTEELVALGHDVTLFASGDSVTCAELEPACPCALRLNPDPVDRAAAQALQMEQLAQRAREFDVVHLHTDWTQLPFFARLGVPFLMTLHGRLDFPEVARLLEISNAPVVSISDAQRHPIGRANWLGTVLHGLPVHRLRPQLKPGQYLAFLGRMCRDKRPDTAIWAARMLGLPIRLAAKVDREDQAYFDDVVRPLLVRPDVAFVGEIGAREKGSFLGNASALLFPIDWPEPFGLVMIEAMACGTPVIAMNRGSVPEVIRDGVSGYIVNNELEFLAAIDQIGNISRAAVRQDFETRFTSQRMARDYVRLYERLLERPAAGPSQFQRTGAGIEAVPSEAAFAAAGQYSNGAATPDLRRSDPLVSSIVTGND
jgi:glycosyltransferase involved in cell wall biosynthesis